MNILQMLALFAQEDNCPSGTPTLDTVTKTDDTLGACPGGGWTTTWLVAITGSLPAYQEYYWEVATNAAGDNWTYKSRGVATSIDVTDTLLGTGGEGASETHYRNARCYIVPVGASVSEACAGPVTGTQASRTATLCVI